MAEFDKLFSGTKDMLETVADIVCADYVMKQNDTVCHGAVAEMGDVLVPVLEQSLLDPDYFCSEFLGQCSSKNYYFFEAEGYVDTILKTKPANIQNDNYLNSLYQSIKGQNRKTIKAVHISDVHVDFLYAVGSDAKCNLPLCCRAENGFPTDPERQAPKWGSYLCDIPPTVLENMLEFVKSDIKPDMLFWTGDNSPHNVWSNDNPEVTEATANITRIIQAHLDSTNISVYPIQGNHDTWPVNVQDFSDPYTNIPINGFSGDWLDWLEPETIA